MTKRFGYPLLTLFVVYLITLNATETGEQGNNFLSFIGGIANALLEFLRGLTGGGGVTQALGL